MKKIPLHTRILIGLVAGLLFGIIAVYTQLPPSITIHYIKPVGDIFVRLLKLIAMPMVLASLIVGIANLGDISKLSKMGGRTLFYFLSLTLISAGIGLTLVNIVKPGNFLPEELKVQLLEQNAAADKFIIASEKITQSPLQPVVDIVSDNIFLSLTDNKLMLQVVFFAIIVGIALLKVTPSKGRPVIDFFNGLNEVIVKIVDFIMLLAPYGVFALLAALIVEVAGQDPAKAAELLGGLLIYCLVVIAGILIIMFVVYPIFLKFYSKMTFGEFMKGMRPAQLLGFSTSSSNATLPVTMECVHKNLNVSEESTSFVLPLGATVNMNGTCLYQAIAAVFIAQAMGIELTIWSQLMILLLATLSAIGAAGVPSAGLVTLVVVMESVGIPASGLTLILAPDRFLDMCRTIPNVTGDALVAVMVDSGNKKADAKRPIQQNEDTVVLME